MQGNIDLMMNLMMKLMMNLIINIRIRAAQDRPGNAHESPQPTIYFELPYRCPKLQTAHLSSMQDGHAPHKQLVSQVYDS